MDGSGRSTLIRLLAAFLSLLSCPSWGDSPESIELYIIQMDKEIAEEIKAIPQLVERYASTLGCNFSMNPKNVVPYPAGQSSVHVALFYLDEGCSGGSRSYSTQLAVIKKGGYTAFYVVPEKSRTSGSLGLIDLIHVEGDQLRYEVLEKTVEKYPCCVTKARSGRLIFNGTHWLDPDANQVATPDHAPS